MAEYNVTSNILLFRIVKAQQKEVAIEVYHVEKLKKKRKA